MKQNTTIEETIEHIKQQQLRIRELDEQILNGVSELSEELGVPVKEAEKLLSPETRRLLRQIETQKNDAATAD
jgi:hypothetical protein